MFKSILSRGFSFMVQFLIGISGLASLTLSACSQEKKNQTQSDQIPPVKVTEKKKVMREVAVIETDFGKIILKFYDADAPKHAANFRKLATQGYYNGTTFHRVIPNFMIQGGDPNSKDQNPNNDGQGGPGYTIPAEIKHFHKRGALAAARTGDEVNPLKASSGSQFYIVQNGPLRLDELNQMEMQIKSGGKPNFVFTQEQKEIYTTAGGVPFLDSEYTVYGEVVSGMEVVDKIASASRDGRDRPFKDIVLKKVSLETMEVEE